MGKYLSKTFAREERQETLGMERRWSSSRGWPGNSQLELAQTSEGGWLKREFRPGHVDVEDLGGPEDLLERKGEDLVKEFTKKAKDKAMIGKIRSVLHDTDVR